MGKDFVSTIVSSSDGLNSVLIGAISAEFFASRGANFPTVTFVNFLQPEHRHLPRPLG
jgi:hypothetical protein